MFDSIFVSEFPYNTKITLKGMEIVNSINIYMVDELSWLKIRSEYKKNLKFQKAVHPLLYK